MSFSKGHVVAVSKPKNPARICMNDDDG